jgi:hypothetical protein
MSRWSFVGKSLDQDPRITAFIHLHPAIFCKKVNQSRSHDKLPQALSERLGMLRLAPIHPANYVALGNGKGQVNSAAMTEKLMLLTRGCHVEGEMVITMNLLK